MSRVMRKQVFGVSDQVRHKSDKIIKENSQRLEIKEIEGLYYLFSENKDANQLHGYEATDLCL